MSIFTWVVLGFLAGGLASLVMGELRGFFLSTIVGVIGALLGGFLFGLFGQRSVTGLNLWSFLVALVGAIILIAFFRALRGPQAS
jgi:uncharacterized membrane protein YeaQ/YmgE (transglycosylase-associated protein family)